MSTPLEEAFPRPSVIGVVNVTPDSFSDGSAFDAGRAIAQAKRLLRRGSGAGRCWRRVDAARLRRRVGGGGASTGGARARGTRRPPRSPIDTSKAEVARRALQLGAVLVNDVTALRADPDLAGVVADANAYLCLMHMLGEPRTMQDAPRYDDVVAEVASFLEERLAAAVTAGIQEERVCLDPGIGFGRRWSTTSSCSRGWTSSSRSAGRYWSALRASASWGGFWAIARP